MMQYSENKIKSLSNTYYENGWVVIKNFISKKKTDELKYVLII